MSVLSVTTAVALVAALASPAASTPATFHLMSIFTVSAAGSYSYYLNAVMSVGGEGADMVVASVPQIDATFYPEPPG